MGFRSLRYSKFGLFASVMVLGVALGAAAFAGNKAFEVRGGRTEANERTRGVNFTSARGSRGLASIDEAAREKAREKEDAAAVTVISLDPEVDLTTFREAGYKVNDYESSLGSGDPWREPDPALRDRVFMHAGLRSVTADWQQLDKDMLFLAAQELTAADLARNFNSLSMMNFAKLRKAIDVEKMKRP